MKITKKNNGKLKKSSKSNKRFHRAFKVGVSFLSRRKSNRADENLDTSCIALLYDLFGHSVLSKHLATLTTS